MRYSVMAFMLLFSVDSLLAQNIESLYECIYKYTVSSKDSRQESFSDVGYCMLQIGNGMGKFYDYSSYQTDSVIQAGRTDPIIGSYKLREQRNVFFFDQVVYQNSPKGKTGDTVSYRLSAFVGKGDITLKDAMRNLPGIDISDNGAIKYLGKDFGWYYVQSV